MSPVAVGHGAKIIGIGPRQALDGGNHLLRADDRLNQFARAPDLSESDQVLVVRVDGQLHLPLANRHAATGLSDLRVGSRDVGRHTILLTEQASSMNAIGNIWPCVSVGPITADGTAGGWGNLYQIDTAAPQNPATLTQNGYNEDQQLYQAHWNRFNYLFHDGHVEALQYTQTVGTTKFVNKPKGMWTVVPGD